MEFSEDQKLALYYLLVINDQHEAAAVFAKNTNFQRKPGDVPRLRYLFSKPIVERFGPFILFKDEQFFPNSTPQQSCVSSVHSVSPATEMAPNNPPAPEISILDSSADSDLESFASSNSPSYDARIEKKEFKEGDKVMVYNACLKLFGGKLKPKWGGPFIVTKVLGGSYLEIQSEDGSRFSASGLRMKLYVEPSQKNGGDLESSASSNSPSYDACIEKKEFKEGDKVKVYNARLKLFGGKLKPKWSGSFIVTKVFAGGYLEIQSEDGSRFTGNGLRMKLYVEPSQKDGGVTKSLDEIRA